MRVLIIGYGSIGARHARVLTDLGAEVAVVTRNSDCPYPVHGSIEAALQDWSPDRIMVCNATAMHRDAADVLLAANYKGLVLVEKPLFATDADLDRFGKLDICVAYNLRFHPLVRRLREEVAGRPLLTANFHAGQYLPDWRPSTDYRAGYSARRSEGGGVLKDLSHELDLAGWFCGSWTRVAAVGGQVSALEIDSDDVYAMLLVHEQCPVVTISLNYLNFAARRTIAINGAGLTGLLDLIAGKLTLNGIESEMSVERDATYIAQARAMLDDDRSILCSFKEGRQTDRLIAAAEQASATGRWVSANASFSKPENDRPGAMKGVFVTYLLPAGLINVGNVFAFLFQFLLARSLTVADYGNFNSLFALINLLASPANIIPFAIARIMIRFESDPGTARTIVEQSALGMSLGAVGVIVLAAIFTTPISSALHIDQPLTELLAFALLATTFLYTTAVGWLQGTGRYIAAAAALASIPILRVVCAGGMQGAGYANLNTAFAATALPGLIVFVAGLVAMRRVFRVKRSALGPGASKDFFRFSALVSVSSLLLMGFWNLDLVIIRILFSPEEAGLYSSAAVLGRIPFLVSGAIVNVLFPEATRAGLLGGETRSVLFRSLGLAAGLGAVTALPMAFAAEPIIVLFAGPAYASAAPLLSILGPAMALFAVVQVLVTFMLARDQYHSLGVLAAGLAVFAGGCFLGAGDPVWVAWCLTAVISIVFVACFGLALSLSSRPVPSRAA